MKKATVVAFLLVAWLSALVGCSDSKEKVRRLSMQEKARQDSIDKASFKVGVMPTLDCLPVFVAHDEKLFDSLGVTVHLKCYSAQMDCDTALERGRVEGAVSEEELLWNFLFLPILIGN